MSGRRLALVVALLIAPACTSPEDEEEQFYLPTEAEARARADNEINDKNADAEFAELQTEIDAEAALPDEEGQ